MLTYQESKVGEFDAVEIAFLDGSNPSNWGIAGSCVSYSSPKHRNKCGLHEHKGHKIYVMLFVLKPERLLKFRKLVEEISGELAPEGLSPREHLEHKLDSV